MCFISLSSIHQCFRMQSPVKVRSMIHENRMTAVTKTRAPSRSRLFGDCPRVDLPIILPVIQNLSKLRSVAGVTGY